jgi:hypothetical protein
MFSPKPLLLVSCDKENCKRFSSQKKYCKRLTVDQRSRQAERDGSNEFANYQPGSLNTTDTLVKDLDNYDIVFHIGDLPYANGYISQWDQFTAQVAPITANKPYMIARYIQADLLATCQVSVSHIFFF